MNRCLSDAASPPVEAPLIGFICKIDDTSCHLSEIPQQGSSGVNEGGP